MHTTLLKHPFSLSIELVGYCSHHFLEYIRKRQGGEILRLGSPDCKYLEKSKYKDLACGEGSLYHGDHLLIEDSKERVNLTMAIIAVKGEDRRHRRRSTGEFDSKQKKTPTTNHANGQNHKTRTVIS